MLQRGVKRLPGGEARQPASISGTPALASSSHGLDDTVVNPLEMVFVIEDGKVKQRKKQRAEQRALLHGPPPGIMEKGDKTFLERRAVTTSREKSYGKAWAGFSRWAVLNGLPVASLSDLDHAVTNKLNVMYFEGQDPADAATLVASVRYHRDDVARTTDLPKSMEAMKGFRKLEPAQGRLPMPYPMLCVVVKELWHKARAVAMWLLVVWATCCRPGEGLKLRKKDLVPPSRMCPLWIVILNAGKPKLQGLVSPTGKLEPLPDTKQTSKVGELDEAVMIDQPYMKGLGPMLQKYAKHKEPEDLLFDFSMHDATMHFNKSIVENEYNKVGIVCTYQLRHGSASTDVLTGLRDLPTVMKRGRWQSQKSVRRYSNGGRISQVFEELPLEAKTKATQAELWMSETLDAGT